MGLIDLQTDLKSLKYSTVPGNGTGPIIQKGIPLTQTSTIGYSAGYAFQGQGFLPALEDDILRIGGWFDQNRGNWALKQSTLEAFNPKTESDLITRVPDVLGINAIASTGGSPLGIYLAKNGIAGFIPEDSKYEANVRENNEDGKNRLVELTNRFIYQNTSQELSFLGPLSGLANSISNAVGGFFGKDDPILFSYVGGPGGPITTVRKASNQKGTNEFSTAFDFKQPITEESLQSSFNPFVPKNNILSPYILPNLGRENNPQSLSIIPAYSGSNLNANFDDTIQTDPYELGLDNVENKNTDSNSYILGLGFSNYEFKNLTGGNSNLFSKYTGSNIDINDNPYISSLGFSNYEFKNLTGGNSNLRNNYSNNDPRFLKNEIINTDDYELGVENATNFYAEGDNSYTQERDNLIPTTPERQDIFPSFFGLSKTSETPKNLVSYNASFSTADSDQISVKPIEPVIEGEIESKLGKDLIKFGFAPINNNTPSYVELIQFRAYLTNFTDNFNPSWDSVKYIGRGEEFYNYTGFSRNVSFNLAFAALTRQELIPLYNKINYLASLTAPDYTDKGYMRGNIVKITIGDYISNQPGIIDSLSYNIEDNAMWEINLEGDDNIGQYPHVLKAQIGMKLIHKGLPQKGYSFIGSGDTVTSFDLLS